MANSQASNGSISFHLADRSLTPLISTSQPNNETSQPQAQALSSLTSTAISAYNSASRLGLGLPQRVMIETRLSGPVILHSYLNSETSQRPQLQHARRVIVNGRNIVQQAREDLRPLSGTTDGSDVAENQAEVEGMVNGNVNGGDYAGNGRSVNTEDHDEPIEEETSLQQPPILIASVVAPNAVDTLDARRVAARLERMGGEFQREFLREQEEGPELLAGGEDD